MAAQPTYDNVHRLVGFNTGCYYSRYGQRITVAELNDRSILFHDHDRKISGMLREKLPGGYTLEQFVLEEYLNNRYDWDHQAMSIAADRFPMKR